MASRRAQDEGGRPDGRGPVLTRNDEAARRIANLYLCFANTSQPIGFQEIWRDFYPEDSEDAAKRKFHRDRAELARCGLSIKLVAGAGLDGLWQVDEHETFAQSDALTPEEARVIDVACLPFVGDPSFARREDLRRALLKIDRAFSGSAVLTVREPHDNDRVRETLNGCQGRLVPVRATYTNARGATSERVLEIWGSFGLRRHVYYVCAEELPEGGLEPAKTYLLDRFSSARELPGRHYAIPEDFSVADYKLLPFQIGDDDFLLEALVPPAALDDLAAHARQAGELSPLASHPELQGVAAGLGLAHALLAGSSVWSVAARDQGRAAAWCVAEGIFPLAPQGVRDAWQGLLRQAADGMADHDR